MVLQMKPSVVSTELRCGFNGFSVCFFFSGFRISYFVFASISLSLLDSGVDFMLLNGLIWFFFWSCFHSDVYFRSFSAR